MKLLVVLAFLCVHMSLTSKESIEEKILKLKDTFKKIEENPNFGFVQRTCNSGKPSYMIQVNIPSGTQRYYGAQNDQETARKAILMIADEYMRSLENVQNGQKKSSATFNQLKLKYDEMFSKQETIPIDAQISRVRNLLKKIDKNPNMCLNACELDSHECNYEVKPCIPLGNTHFYGTQYDQTAAQRAVLMIVKKYLESLELVRDGKAKSPASFHQLKLEYDEIFPNIIAMILKFENTWKKVEKNPNFGINVRRNCFIVRLTIPPEGLHWYGSHHDHQTARKAVLMIANEYKNSLELVQKGKAKSPATKEDLQLKYDVMFSKSKQQISNFEDTLKKIEQNPNFGMQKIGHRYHIALYIPRGERYLYGSHYDYATARKAVQMIANEYTKSLEAKSPETFHQLKLKCDAMFGEIQKSSGCNCKENNLDIEKRKKNLVMIFQITPHKPNQTDEENGISRDNSKLKNGTLLNSGHNTYREKFSKKQPKNRSRKRFQRAERGQTRAMKQTLRKATDENNYATSSEETDEKPSSKVYKIRRIWNAPEYEPEHDFILGGYFKVLNPPDVFWVNTIKQVGGRLSGYYEEYGGCSGWVNLEYFDSTDFEGLKEVNANLKRKREENESSIGECESEESTRGSLNN